MNDREARSGSVEQRAVISGVLGGVGFATPFAIVWIYEIPYNLANLVGVIAISGVAALLASGFMKW